MLLGAKLGDILGRNRAFAIGLAIYGVGSLTTALSPNLGVLLVGWSGVEGFGAVLVVPAIAALTAATYEGNDRALAYALLGGIAAIAVAAGPLIGGWVTTEFTWRYVFAAETVVVILILLLRGQIAQAPRAGAASAARHRGGGAFLGRPGPDRGRDPAQQRVGLRPVAHAADDQRHGDHAAGLLRGAVHGARRSRAAVGVRRVGAASRPSGPRRAARHGAAAHLAAAGGAVDAGRAAVRPDGHVLRHPGVPAGRAGARRVRDRQAPAAAVGGDARLRAAGPADRGPALAARRRADRAGRGQHRRARDARDARRDAERHRLQGGAGSDRSGCRAARVAARERHHVRRRAHADQRGGRAPGHRPEPRVLARHGDRRRGAARVARDRLQRAHHRQPRRSGGRARDDRREGRRGDRHRARRGRRGRCREGGLTPDQARAVADDYGDAQLDALRLSLGAVALAALLSLWLTRRLPTRSLAETDVGATEATAVA